MDSARLAHLRRVVFVGTELFGPVRWRDRPRFALYLARSRAQKRRGQVGRAQPHPASEEFLYGDVRVRLPLGRPAGLKFLLEIFGRREYEEFSTTGARLFFDIGANVGGLALQRALRDPDLRVVAVEPRASTFDDLRANVTLNGLTSRIATVRAAVSDRAGSRLLGLPEDSTMGVVREPGAIDTSGPTVEVPATTLDGLAAEHGLPDALKIDVEGHELAVLSGGAHVLRHVRRVVMEVHTPDRRDACSAVLEAHGLRVTDAYPLLFATREVGP